VATLNQQVATLSQQVSDLTNSANAMAPPIIDDPDFAFVQVQILDVLVRPLSLILEVDGLPANYLTNHIRC
jgi:hypothetical protein